MIQAQQEQIRALCEAQQQQTAAVTAIADAVARPEVGSDLTVNALWTDYAPTIDKLDSAASIRSAVKPTIEHFGDEIALKLKPRDWDYYVEKVAPKRETRQGGPPAPATLNQELRYLKRCFNYHVEGGTLARNPLLHAKLLKTAPRTTTIPREKDADFVRVARPLMAVIYLVGVDSGMRPGEVRVLQRSWVDWDSGLVRLPWNKTKTDKARNPRLSARALAALRDVPVVLGSPYFFANPVTKQPYCKSTIHWWWRDAAEEAGLVASDGEKRVHQHDGRHTAATRMARVAKIPAVMKQLGQTSAQTALRYIHADESDLDDLKQHIDDALTDAMRRPAQRVEPRSEEKQATKTKTS